MLSAVMNTVWLILAINFGKLSAFFDVDEINSINYGIDIASEPIVAENAPMGGTVFLTTKYGQQYHCSFPEKGEADQLRQKEEEEAMETGITELLKSMEKAPCLIFTKGWWSYEFCFGQYIKQYHLEDGKISSEVLFLGHYSRDFDWSNTTNIRKQRSWISRYHSQEYVNGTQCDLTSKLRKATVKFFCENSQGDYISRVDETETCVYTLSVQTPRICKHPYLKPPQPMEAVPITCNPLLSAEEYQDYLETLEPVEAVTESITDPVEISDEPSIDEDTGVVDTADDPSMDSFQQIISRSLMEGLKDILGEDTDDNVQITNMKMKTLQNPGDLDALLQKILSEEKKKSKTKEQDTEDTENEDEIESDMKSDPDDSTDDTLDEDGNLITDSGQTENNVIEDMEDEEEIEEDEEILYEFDKGLDDIAESNEHLQQIKNYKDKLQQEITDQFDDILKEVEEEFSAVEEETEIDSEMAMKTMKDTLNKLMKQLQDKKVSGSVVPTLNSEETDEEQIEKDEVVKPEDKQSDEDDIYEDSDSDDEEQADKSDVDYVNMEYDLAVGGNKIQVKIYTSADTYEEATGNMLENGAALGKMIVAVLGANTDEVKEIQRQEKMEDNYNFVWKSKKNSKLPEVEADENS